MPELPGWLVLSIVMMKPRAGPLPAVGSTVPVAAGPPGCISHSPSVPCWVAAARAFACSSSSSNGFRRKRQVGSSAVVGSQFSPVCFVWKTVFPSNALAVMLQPS